MKRRPILNFIVETTSQSIVDSNGFRITPLNLYALNNTLVHVTLLEDGQPLDLSHIDSYFFGIDYSFEYQHTELVYVDEFNVDSTWDDVSLGRTSFILDLRTNSILNYMQSTKTKDVICELWCKSTTPKCLLYQQNCKINNTILFGFPSLCGIGSMQIQASNGCKFRVY